MNQKDAVYQVIQQLKPQEVEAAEKGGEPVTLTKQEKKHIEKRIFDGFKAKKIQYNNELPSDDKLAIYVSGLVSNWLRKDKRLNGNKTYVPRNPGVRTGLPSPSVLPTVDPATLQAAQQLAGEGAEVQVLVIRRPARPSPVAASDHADSDNHVGQ